MYIEHQLREVHRPWSSKLWRNSLGPLSFLGSKMLPLFLFGNPLPPTALCDSVKEMDPPGTSGVLAPSPQKPGLGHQKEKGRLWHCPLRLTPVHAISRPRLSSKALLCHPGQMAPHHFGVLSTKPPCRTPPHPCSLITFVLWKTMMHFSFAIRQTWKALVFSPFVFLPKNQTKPKYNQKPISQKQPTSSPFILFTNRRLCFHPNSPDWNFAFRFFLEFFF